MRLTFNDVMIKIKVKLSLYLTKYHIISTHSLLNNKAPSHEGILRSGCSDPHP
jgi:hypothetical protein